MAESRQEIIDIQDCEYIIFQGFPHSPSFRNHILIEFLRYLYCKEVKLDADLAIKLLKFSDRYLQDDLNDKCMDFLKYNLNSDDVYTVLDFARQENISPLANWCLEFFDSNLNINNVSKLIQYIEQMSDPEFLTQNPRLKDKIFDIVFDNFLDALQSQKENLRFYEDFLIKNVNMDTIVSLANWISDESSEHVRLFARRSYGNARNDTLKRVRDIFEQNTINLQRQVLDFADKNFEALQEKDMIKDIEKNFFVKLVSYGIQQRKSQKTQEAQDHDSDTQSKKGLKRMEPSNNGSISEGNPRLKQTKKDFAEKK